MRGSFSLGTVGMNAQGLLCAVQLFLNGCANHTHRLPSTLFFCREDEPAPVSSTFLPSLLSYLLSSTLFWGCFTNSKAVIESVSLCRRPRVSSALLFRLLSPGRLLFFLLFSRGHLRSSGRTVRACSSIVNYANMSR